MEISQIGNRVLTGSGVKTIKFNSNDYFLDADLLAIDMKAIIAEFLFLFDNYASGSIISFEQFTEFKTVFNNRKKEISTYLNNGNSLFVYNASFERSKFHTMKSGVKNLEEFDFHTLFELDKGFHTNPLVGSSVKIDDIELREAVAGFPISYNFVYNSYLGEPLFKVKNTGEIIGVRHYHNGGNLFLFPELRLPKNNLVKIHLQFLPKSLIDQKTILPDWCLNYFLENESKERKKLVELQKEALDISFKIESQNELLEEFNQLKRLLISTGTELELLVADIFKEFGYEIEMPPNNRDDIKIKKDGSVAVIEIKGVKGSSAEKHAAQLMKWVSTYHSENDIQPKGILIVNGFKDIPINDRTEKIFTNQMIPYSTRMELCLLTTNQLLELIILFRSGKIDLEKIHKELFATIGEFDLDNLRKEAN